VLSDFKNIKKAEGARGGKGAETFRILDLRFQIGCLITANQKSKSTI